MQNGAFPWVSPSLASATQKSPWPGYQASLTDLFLKKNPLQFATSGISQLAAASSYLEKMSTLSGPMSGQSLNPSANSPGPVAGPSSASPSDILITHASHPHSGLTHKCPHPDHKDKSYPCDICQQYSGISVSSSLNKSSDVATTCSARMNPNESLEHKPPHFSAVPPGHLHPHPAHLHPSAGVPGLQHHHHHHHHHQSQRRPSATSASSSMSRNRNASNNKQFLCPVCHKLFTQKGNLKTHMMIHTGDKPYACHICGKSFTQKGNVDTHMKIHTGEKDYRCDSCGKGFTQKGNLKTHVRSVHTKEKPFACGVCGKSFSQKGNMQTHIRTHNKDDRFPCTLCGKTFSQKGNLKTHMQRHAGTLPAKRYGQRRQVGHSRLLQVHSQTPSAYSLAANTDQSPREQSQLNRSSTDEDSVPPLDHSLVHRSGGQMIGHQPHISTPDDILSPQNLQLKYAHQSGPGRDPLSALVSLQNSALHQQSQLQQHQHRSPGSSPITPENMVQFSSCSAQMTSARLLYSTPTSMATPLAAHQTWLAAAGASSNLTGPTAHKSRSSTNPYDAFSGLPNPYGGFAAVQASPLSRLSLFTGVGVGANEHLSHHHKQQHSTDSTNSATPSVSHTSSSQHQFQTSNPNPDFSQLLE